MCFIKICSVLLVINHRNRVRQYPAFVNCTTIDLFTEWPHDALLEVAEKYLEGMDLGAEEGVSENIRDGIVLRHLQ